MFPILSLSHFFLCPSLSLRSHFFLCPSLSLRSHFFLCPSLSLRSHFFLCPSLLPSFSLSLTHSFSLPFSFLSSPSSDDFFFIYLSFTRCTLARLYIYLSTPPLLLPLCISLSFSLLSIYISLTTIIFRFP